MRRKPLPSRYRWKTYIGKRQYVLRHAKHKYTNSTNEKLPMRIKLSISKAERDELKTLNIHAMLGEQSPAYRLIKKIEAAWEQSEKQTQYDDVKILKTMTWYLAEVSFRQSNPIHRCLAFHRGDGYLELTAAGYEEKIATCIDKLAYFRPVQKLSAMDEECSAFLPKDVPAPIIVYIEKFKSI